MKSKISWHQKRFTSIYQIPTSLRISLTLTIPPHSEHATLMLPHMLRTAFTICLHISLFHFQLKTTFSEILYLPHVPPRSVIIWGINFMHSSWTSDSHTDWFFFFIFFTHDFIPGLMLVKQSWKYHWLIFWHSYALFIYIYFICFVRCHILLYSINLSELTITACNVLQNVPQSFLNCDPKHSPKCPLQQPELTVISWYNNTQKWNWPCYRQHKWRLWLTLIIIFLDAQCTWQTKVTDFYLQQKWRNTVISASHYSSCRPPHSKLATHYLLKQWVWSWVKSINLEWHAQLAHTVLQLIIPDSKVKLMVGSDQLVHRWPEWTEWQHYKYHPSIIIIIFN